MSYLNQDPQEETCHEVETKKIPQNCSVTLLLIEVKESNAQISFFDVQAATLVYDSLLRDIERAQTELSSINTALANTGVHQVLLLFELSENQNRIPGNKCGRSVCAEE